MQNGRRLILLSFLALLVIAVLCLLARKEVPIEPGDPVRRESSFIALPSFGSGSCDPSGDKKTDFADLTILKTYWKGFPEPVVDCDHDGKIDARNLAVMLASWSVGIPPIPELPLSAGPSLSKETGYFHLAVPSSTPAVGERFVAYVLVSTRGPYHGAGDVTVTFDSEHLRVRSVRTDQSLWTVWMESPRPPYGRRLTFAGGHAGGVSASRGVIAAIEFEVTRAGPAAIRIAPDAYAYRLDATGTRIKLEDTTEVVVSAGEAAMIPEPHVALDMASRFAPDVTPPNIDPLLVAVPGPGSRLWMVDFNGEDKGDGIETYLIQEDEHRTIQTNGVYVLKNQDPGYREVHVVVTDRAGNVHEEELLFRVPRSDQEELVAAIVPISRMVR